MKCQQNLVQYQNNRRTNGHNVDKTKLDEKLASLNRKTAEHGEIKDQIIILNETIAKNQTRRDEVQNELMTLGAGSGNIKDVENIVREEAEKKQALSGIEKQLENLLADRLPYHLVPANLIESVKTHLSGEKTLLNWEAQKQELEPRRNKFTAAFFNTQPMSNQNEKNKTILERCITEAWETLYFPRPDGCADIVLHDYLESRQRQYLDGSFSFIQVGANQIRELVAKRKNIKARLKELELRRIKLEGVDNDGVLQTLNQELSNIQDKLEQQNKQLGSLERQETALATDISKERATYERENDYYIKSEPAKSIAHKAQKVIRLIDDLLPRLFELKTKELSQAVTQRYKQLAHKDQIEHIAINADGSCQFYAKNDKELKFDRAAGENQLFATALFAGLAQVSGYHIPLVVDTPLARLDSQHRENLLRYWYSDPDRQVILLSQDKEVDKALMQTISPYLGKTYLLESAPIGDGVYRTIARENAYFGGNHE
jgi:DNA sulfur modification protein DndD